MEGEQVKQPQRKVGRKLVLFPVPLQGHITPMFHLANLLYSKGFSIIIIQARYNSLDPTHFPHFTFHFLEDGVPRNSLLSSKNLASVMSTVKANCEQPFRACLSQILSAAAADQEPVACLISDAMWFFAGFIAESFNLPRVVLRTSSMSAFVVNECLPDLRVKGYFLLPETQSDQPVKEVPPFKVRDLPKEANHDILAALVKQTKTSQGVICNTFEELEGSSIEKVRQVLSIPIFPIGPMHKHLPTSAASIWAQDQTSISWLNMQAPHTVLYISFGSTAVIDEAEFLEIAWALANSNLPFLWVVRPGLCRSEASDLFPEGYLEMVSGRGHIVKWAPQLEVLSHPAVGGFWTHCGWNSTVESICEGVPMLCLPYFADQATNARQVSDNWKIGLQLEKGMRREEMQKAIRKLMVETEGEEMTSRIRTLKEYAIQCPKEGGSSFRSLESLTSYLLSFS